MRTAMEEDRLWVFERGSKELGEFNAGGELAKHITLVGVGPGGLTIKRPIRTRRCIPAGGGERQLISASERA